MSDKVEQRFETDIHTCYTCPYLIFRTVSLLTVNVFGGKHSVWSTSIWNFAQHPVTYLILIPLNTFKLIQTRHAGGDSQTINYFQQRRIVKKLHITIIIPIVLGVLWTPQFRGLICFHQQTRLRKGNQLRWVRERERERGGGGNPNHWTLDKHDWQRPNH